MDLRSEYKLPVLEHTDQGNIIVFLCEIFLDLLEISHKDLKILLVSVAVGIDTAAASWKDRYLSPLLHCGTAHL